MSKPLVSDTSIVIPVYNRGALVLEAIRSALSQVPRPREVIVVDDGSTDDTVRQIEESQLDVVLVCAEHQGRSEARNRGIAVSTGEYIGFLDSDDRWLPSKLSRQLALIHEMGPRTIATGYVKIIDGTGREDSEFTARLRKLTEKTVRSRFDLPSLLFHPAIYPSSLLMSREVLQAVGGFDATMEPLEDWDLMLRLAEEHYFRAVPWPPVIEYRVHTNNTGGQSIAYGAVAVCNKLERGGLDSWSASSRSAMHLARGRALRSLGEGRTGRGEIARSIRRSPFWALRHGALRLLAGSFFRRQGSPTQVRDSRQEHESASGPADET